MIFVAPYGLAIRSRCCFSILLNLIWVFCDVHMQCPPVPEGSSEWVVCTLHWDLPSTLLAVGLTRYRQDHRMSSCLPGFAVRVKQNLLHLTVRLFTFHFRLTCILRNDYLGRIMEKLKGLCNCTIEGTIIGISSSSGQHRACTVSASTLRLCAESSWFKIP